MRNISNIKPNHLYSFSWTICSLFSSYPNLGDIKQNL